MIIAAITALTLLFGGAIFTFDNIRDAAEEVIKDKDRAKQVVSLTKQADDEYETFAKNLNELSEQFLQINQDYNATREELDSFSTRSKKNRMAFLEKFVELRFQVKGLVTVEEWQAMHIER